MLLVEEQLQDCKTAVEWFLSNKSAFAFVLCWKERCPRTIEYTPQQLRKLLAAIDLFTTATARCSPNDTAALNAALLAVSEALRLETVSPACPR